MSTNNGAESSNRPAKTIVRALATNALDPASVTEGEEAALLRWCRESESLHLRKIEDRIARGSHRHARKAAFAMRGCLGSRYLSLWHSRPATLRDHTMVSDEIHSQLREARLFAILNQMPRLAKFGEAAEADVFARRKRSSRGTLTDEHRVLFSFSWTDRARQRLIAESIKPFANLHPCQFMLRRAGGRGRSAVCEYLRRELPNLPADHVFLQLDVRNFFGSISPAWLERSLGLPPTIVRRHVHTGEMSLRMMRSVRAHLSGGEIETLIRRVLPQGSALASLVAEMAMAEVLWSLADRLPSSVRLIVYSDNLGIFVSRNEAAAVEDLLRQAFASAGAGSFRLQGGPPVPIGSDFRFLGHWWRLREGVVTVYVPEETAAVRAAVITNDLLTATGIDLIRMRQRVTAQANEWALWPGVTRWAASTHDQIAAAMTLA